MPRGGARIPGPGKKIGRPKKPKQALAAEEFKHQILKARLRKWGVAVGDFQKQLELQQGRCAVCAELLTEGWVIDHDPMTLEFRGLLHNNCNVLLAMAKDDPTRLERAAAYLRKHNRFLS